MNPEHKALGLYYFNKKSAEEAALSAGVDPKTFAEKVATLDSECIKVFEEFYNNNDISLGYIAEQQGIRRNAVLGFSIKYGLNQSYGDKASKEKLNALKKAV